MAAIIEFEGLGENILSGLKAGKDAVVSLRVESEKTTDAMKAGAESAGAPVWDLPSAGPS